jgi:hypothetical protein
METLNDTTRLKQLSRLHSSNAARVAMFVSGAWTVHCNGRNVTSQVVASIRSDMQRIDEIVRHIVGDDGSREI